MITLNIVESKLIDIKNAGLNILKKRNKPFKKLRVEPESSFDI